MFDCSAFRLKFPSVVDIVQEIASHGDIVTLAKIDMARDLESLFGFSQHGEIGQKMGQ